MRLLPLVFALALVAGLSSSARAQTAQPYEINVILPLTGYGAFLGRGYSETLAVLEKYVNASGGIRGRPLRFVIADSQSSPQVDLQLTGTLLAKRPPIVFEGGPATVCRAVAPLYANGPVMWCLSPAFFPKPGSYGFSAGITREGMEAVVNYVRTAGLRRIAFITFTDIAGQDADAEMREFLAQPVNRDLSIVNWEHFGASDLSVNAQIAKIKQADAQVVIGWATGAPIATVLRGVKDAGLTLPFITTAANQTWPQMQQYKDLLPREYLTYSLLWPEYDTLRGGPLKAPLGTYLREMQAAGAHPDNATATVWDPAMVVVSALRKLGTDATAEQLRVYISGLHDYYGPSGSFDFRQIPQSGIGLSDVIMVRWDAATSAWIPVSSRGGAATRPVSGKG